MLPSWQGPEGERYLFLLYTYTRYVGTSRCTELQTPDTQISTKTVDL